MKKIKIVGAGLTGLSTAYYLTQNGYKDIKIIEKDSNVGGRIQKFDTLSLQSGAFMIYSWYFYLKTLLKEIKLDTKLKPFKFTDSYYKTNEVNFLTENDLYRNYSLGVKLKFIFLLARNWFKSDFNIYDFSSIGSARTFQELLEANFGKNSDIEKMSNMLLQSYGYGSTADLPASFLAIYKESFLHGWIKDCHFLEGGTNILTEKLQEILIDRGVEFEFNTSVDLQNISKDDTFVFTGIKSLPISINYLEYESLLVEFYTNKFPVEKWFITYFQHPNSQIYSLFNPLSIVEFEENIKIIYKPKSLDFEDINKHLNEIFDGNSVKKILEQKSWSPIMPKGTIEQINTLKKMQGVNNHFYAGDYLHTLPSMETAVYSAKNVVKIMMKNEE